MQLPASNPQNTALKHQPIPDALASLTQTAPPEPLTGPQTLGQDGHTPKKMLQIIRLDRKGIFAGVLVSEEPEAVALQLIQDGKAKLFEPKTTATPTQPPNAPPEAAAQAPAIPYGGYHSAETYAAALEAARRGIHFPTPEEIMQRAIVTRRTEERREAERETWANGQAWVTLKSEVVRMGHKFNPNRMKHFRKRSGMSQFTAASGAGWGNYGAQRWSNYENGRLPVGFAVAVAVAKALSVRPIDLYGPTLEGMDINTTPYEQGYKTGQAEGYKAGFTAGDAAGYARAKAEQEAGR